jgi:hypothetical protein
MKESTTTQPKSIHVLPKDMLDLYVNVLAWSNQDNHPTVKKSDSRANPILQYFRMYSKTKQTTQKKQQKQQQKQQRLSYDCHLRHVRGECFQLPRTLDAESTAMTINIALNTHGQYSWEVVYIVHSRRLFVRKTDQRKLVLPSIQIVGIPRFID